MTAMPGVVYNSFNGRYSDNPRAIYEELARRGAGYEHLWTAEPGRPAPFPPATRSIEPSTPEHRRAVGAAKYIVANVEMREHLRKTPGMVFLQTWHGTALKRIGYDNRYVHANPAGFERDVEEYRRWDYLISPNAFTSEVMRSAFRGFDGEILETGYPRNDVLNSPEREAIRARVRRQLGIEDGQRAVLYAPTWRDNLYHEQGPGSFELALDVDEMARRLGDDHVLMLRLHFLVAGAAAGARGDAVRDVSQFEDIRELYLAADALITDYSSVMFDFAITGKPLLFYTYDLTHYRDELRGFYFNFEAEAPGPLCMEMDELIEALADERGTRRQFADRYAAFRRRYCYLDDGRAAERVVDRVFTELGASGRVALDGGDRDVGRVGDDRIHA
jgi:CDP-glycerol glycerophosphotransferase